MSGTDDVSDRAYLEQAATWFVQMRDPEGGGSRAEFETWLAEDPRHRAAYSQIAEAFSLGKGLVRPDQKERNGVYNHSSKGTGRRLAAIVALMTGLAGAGWLAVDSRLGPGPSLAARNDGVMSPYHGQSLATHQGEIRRFRLPDGSGAVLDTNSLVSVHYDGRHRILRLERGRARFIVAHEKRPFVVAAAGGFVTAHGTIFDVRLVSSDAIMVRLLRGAIDVDMPRRTGAGKVLRSVQRLSPGEAVAFSATNLLPRAQRPAGDGDDWPVAMRELEAVRLSDLIAEANRYALTPIALASPDIGNLRLSGVFRIADSRSLADKLAAVLGLEVNLAISGRITLQKPCRDGQQINCGSPS